MLSVLTTRKHHQQQRDRRRLLKVMDVFTTLIVVIILCVFAYVQTHPLYILNISSFGYINYTSIKLIKK